MLKTLKQMAKAVLAVAVIVVVIMAVGQLVQTFALRSAVEQTVSAVVGDGATGELVTEVLVDDEVSDETIMDALSIDSDTYSQVESAAAELGVDLNDSEQLRDIAVENVDNVEELQEVMDSYSAGELSDEEALAAFANTLEIPQEE